MKKRQKKKAGIDSRGDKDGSRTGSTVRGRQFLSITASACPPKMRKRTGATKTGTKNRKKDAAPGASHPERKGKK